MEAKNNDIVISICLITYNHSAFIRQAIESVLMQVVDFSWEFIIADDYSNDGTRDILFEYQKKYPQIKLILQKENVGPAKNWMDLIAGPTGKYIAYFEGDDYWTDSNKLQKQVNFLDANSDYVICYHNVQELLPDGKLIADSVNSSKQEITYTIKDLAQRNMMHTPSVVFRNGLIKEFPAWFATSPVGDYVLHMLNAQFGKIKYFPEPMAVYRKHSVSAWSSLNDIERLKKWLIVLEYLIKDFDGEVRTELERQYSHCVIQIAECYKAKNNMEAYYDTIVHYFAENEGAFKQWLLKDVAHLQELEKSYPIGVKRSFKHLSKAINKSFFSN